MLMKSDDKLTLIRPQLQMHFMKLALDKFGISCEYVGASAKVDAYLKQGGAKESFFIPSRSIGVHTNACQHTMGAIMQV